ncbi:unnamed protein product [Caenorhabditis auriculariae]|uniref:Uncharacterized protein n=1 Tax=Caenorhabditis auriculariae TaxID=2777116 RepID=A0A8S1GW37_9PELO|nr:unnamed protein product [Caenorhabditis auriculariae]
MASPLLVKKSVAKKEWFKKPAAVATVMTGKRETPRAESDVSASLASTLAPRRLRSRALVLPFLRVRTN